MPPKTLVVEDDETLRYLIIDAMTMMDVDIIPCGTADEAIKTLESVDSFALVLTDVRKPGLMDGWDLMNHIHERWPALPVVVSSGHRLIQASELLENFSFLPKPWDLDVLLGTVESVLLGDDYP